MTLSERLKLALAIIFTTEQSDIEPPIEDHKQRHEAWEGPWFANCRRYGNERPTLRQQHEAYLRAKYSSRTSLPMLPDWQEKALPLRPDPYEYVYDD